MNLSTQQMRTHEMNNNESKIFKVTVFTKLPKKNLSILLSNIYQKSNYWNIDEMIVHFVYLGLNIEKTLIFFVSHKPIN